MARVAFFGVGLMGEPMAGHLLQAGHSVKVVGHRNREPVERLVAAGAGEAGGSCLWIVVLPAALAPRIMNA